MPTALNKALVLQVMGWTDNFSGWYKDFRKEQDGYVVSNNICGYAAYGKDALNGEDDEREEEQVEAIGDEEVEREEKHEEEAEEEIPEEFRKIIHYLKDFEHPEGLTCKKYLQFQHFATKFLLCEERILFRQAKPNILPKRVIWGPDERIDIISKLHNESGPRGKQGTYSKVALRYWWPHQYGDVENFVKTCKQC